MTTGKRKALFNVSMGFKEGSWIVPFVRFYGIGQVKYNVKLRVMETERIDDGIYRSSKTNFYHVKGLQEMKFDALPVVSMA